MKAPDTAIKQFESAAEQAVERIRQWPKKAVRLFHHNDADGLTSGAVLTKAFNRAGFSVKGCCLEKPYPAILKKIFKDSGQLILFADFAGRIAPLIARLNSGKNLVVIIDHHPAVPSPDPTAPSCSSPTCWERRSWGCVLKTCSWRPDSLASTGPEPTPPRRSG